MHAKTITVEGEVRHEVVAPGSKSERKAVVLTMHSGEKYVLQRDRAIHSRTRRWTSSSAIRLRPKDWRPAAF